MALPLSPNSPFSSPKRYAHPDGSDGAQKPSKYTRHGEGDYEAEEKGTPSKRLASAMERAFRSMGTPPEVPIDLTPRDDSTPSPFRSCTLLSKQDSERRLSSPDVATLASQFSGRSSSSISLRPSPSPPLIASPVRFDMADIHYFKNRVDMLSLLGPMMEKRDPALRLVRWFFEPGREPKAIESTRPFIDGFFKMVCSGEADARSKFIASLRPFAENARAYFADPLSELIENGQMAIAAQILLAYVSIQSLGPVAQFTSQGEVVKLLQSPVSYRPFPWLFDDSLDVCGYISSNLRNEFCPLMLRIIPEAYKRHLIDSEDIELLTRRLRTQVCSPESRMICTIENEPLLDQVLQMLEGVKRICVTPIEIDLINQKIQEFRSVYVLDPKHLTEPQLRRGELVGLHQYPEDGQATYETEEARIDVRVKYPHLVARSSVTAPYTANISSGGSSAYQKKISTFPGTCPDLTTQIRAIETVLSRPMNDPLRDPEINRRHIGMVGHEAWMVYTNGRRIGTAFPILLFESRDLDTEKESRVIPHLRVKDELGLPARPVATKFSPQKKLVEHVRRSLRGESETPRHKRAPSNEEIRPVCDRIKQMLSGRGRDYKLIPTLPGRPILVQVSLAACGVEMRDLLISGYRPSGEPSSATKRMKDDEIAEVFDAEDNGIYVILRYPNIETFTRLVLSPT